MKRDIKSILNNQKQILPLLLIIAYCIEAIVKAVRGEAELAGIKYEFTLSTEHYIAFGLVFMNLLIYFFIRKFYKYTLGLTIAVGLFNIVTFSAIRTTTSFGVGSLAVSFQLEAFWVGLLPYIINFKKVNEYVIDNLTTKSRTEEQKNTQKIEFAERVKKFKHNYENYSTENLTEIVTKNKYVPEALEAARELLAEMKINKNENLI